MARTRTPAAPPSQFYINLSTIRASIITGFSPDDFGYAVFGRVIEGMDVVDRIGAVKTGIARRHGRRAG